MIFAYLFRQVRSYDKAVLRPWQFSTLGLDIRADMKTTVLSHGCFHVGPDINVGKRNLSIYIQTDKTQTSKLQYISNNKTLILWIIC